MMFYKAKGEEDIEDNMPEESLTRVIFLKTRKVPIPNIQERLLAES